MQTNFHTIIIGGGAAGMMAAISSKRAHPERSVAIIDRTFALGRKLLVCGAGRCNITNVNLDKSIRDHYYGAEHDFTEAIFRQFTFQDIINFFQDLGVELYVERKTDIGKLFPVTDQAKTITELLYDELQRLNVQVFLNTEVTDIQPPGTAFAIKTHGLDPEGNRTRHTVFTCEKLILSAGGKTYPALGSNGTGYALAESLGHTLIQPVPSALPLESKNPLSHLLQGTKLDVEVTSIIEGKEIKTRTDDVMFTQYGISGPAVLNTSREVSIHINREHKSNVQAKLNFLPGKSVDEVRSILKERWEKRPTQQLEKSLYGLLPNKVAEAILIVNQLPKQLPVSQLSDAQTIQLTNALTNTLLPISGTRTWNEAEFTAGGIDTTEVEKATLLSLRVPGLYLCGEILDVDGDVGGFNLSWAWASGNVVGKQ